MQTELNFSQNPFSEGSQNHRLWEYLKVHRVVTTKELHHELCMDTARLRDLRKKGLIIECHSIPGDQSSRLYKVIN